ncbi:hypothetical protein EPK99_23465 [Neorhizobium lilium]|uniref:Uncharacterized protein n=1 Tax=Neorhizobium lilium TaxID=2503024 RepID=A0A3S3VEM8_9HYPH|nr:hypothetical protein EPK99_23465 [Neorhizobium lilium]
MNRPKVSVFTQLTQDTPVPYAERLIALSGGPALIWPYYNILPDEGPFEIAPDSNCYRNPAWVEQLPSSMPRHNVIVNLLPALTEEWLANEKFRIDPERWIMDIVVHYEERGVCFRGSYATDLANMLRKHADAQRYNWTLLFYYVAIIKKLLEKRNVEEAMQELVKVSNADVPRAGMMLSLGALSLFLKRNQRLRLPGDPKLAYSFVQRFFDFQPGQKGEVDHLSVAYLRNRSLDLGMYYFFPAITSLGQQPVGETIIATRDAPLQRLIFRVLPFLFDPTAAPDVPTSIAVEEFASDDGLAFFEWRSRLNKKFEPPLNEDQRLKRLANLADYAKGLCDMSDEKDALDEVWREWTLPYLEDSP